MDKKLCIGIMSGTSLDGVDVCLVELDGYYKNTNFKIVDFETFTYSDEEKNKIHRACDKDSSDVALICSLNVELGKKYGDCVNKLLSKNKIKSEDIYFVSSHGQTIYHMPEIGATLQIGELAEIAAKTGILTIGDYRPSDMAVGGQGAPLIPYIDYVLFGSEDVGRILVNIGGISNLTLIKKDSSEDEIFAFDCGVGNILIDYCAEYYTNGKQHYDKDSQLGMMGSLSKKLLEYVESKDIYIHKAPPKTTGREFYNKKFFRDIIEYASKHNISKYSVIHTLSYYTAYTVSKNIEANIDFDDYDEIYIGGGGYYNPLVMKYLKELNEKVVLGMDNLGVSSDKKEALGFAILGNEFMNKHYNNLKTATNASKNIVMGKMLYPPMEG
jgi:anhydro-N-acetylmuramic acid kinase